MRPIRIEDRCSACGGWGWRYHGPDSAPCDVCGTTGRRPGAPPWECPQCDMAGGYIDIGVATITCPLCNGTGSLLPEPAMP